MTYAKPNKIKVVPVEVCIEQSEVVKRYPITEALEIVRCKTAIFFHSTCFWVVSKPTLANNMKGGALFEMLQWYCDYQDERDKYSAEDQEKYDTLCAVIVNLLTIPLDAFTDINYCLDLGDATLKLRNEYYERLAKEAENVKEETLEDALADAEFEGEMMMQEQIASELKEMAEKNEAGQRAD